MSTDDETPVVVFSGQYTEAVFLQSLLGSAKIESRLTGYVEGDVPLPNHDSSLYVRRADAADAMALVADFIKNGKRTTTW